MVSSPEQSSSYPRTFDEQDGLDDDVDRYLRDATVPARPRGYQWFLRLPPGLSAEEFWSAANRAAAQAGPSPAQTAAAVAPALRALR